MTDFALRTMANPLETWWTENYPKCTLESLETWPIYSKFQSSERPFSKTLNEVTESFHISEKVSFYECRSEFSSEKLNFFPAFDTWLYEKRSKSPENTSESMTWRHPNCEWGVLTHKDKDLDRRESWKLEGSSRVYEQVTVQNSVTTGERHGSTQSATGQIEDWSESLLESPTEIRFERNWKQPGSSGGEIRGKVGLRHYGETWFRSSTASETKQWSSEAGREQGSCSGCTGKLKFSHSWDFEGVKKSETKTYQEGVRNWGSRKIRIGEGKWLNEEWEGLPPTDLGQSLSIIYENCIAALQASEATLESLSTPETAEKVQSLSFQRKESSPGQKTDSKLIGVLKALKLLTEQEELKRTLYNGIRSREARELSEELADIVSVYSGLLRLIASSSIEDSSISESRNRAETQLQKLQKSTDCSNLEEVRAYLQFLKDQTRVIQVFMQKLITREAEINKSVSQIKTLLEQIIEQVEDQTEDREETGKVNEIMKELRLVSKVEDLKQSLPKVINCVLASRPNPSDSESSLFPLLTALSDSALALETDFLVPESSSTSLNTCLSEYRTHHALSSFCQALTKLLMRLHDSSKKVPSQTVDWPGFMREVHLCALILSEIGTFLANDIHDSDLFSRAHALGLAADRILIDFEATKDVQKGKNMSKLIQQYGSLLSDVSAQTKVVKSSEKEGIKMKELETLNEIMKRAVEIGVEMAQGRGSELLEEIENDREDLDSLIPAISNRAKIVLKLLRIIQEQGENREAGGKRKVFDYEKEGEIVRLREELELKDNRISELKTDLDLSRANETRARKDLLELVDSHDSALCQLSELKRNRSSSLPQKRKLSNPDEEISRLKSKLTAQKLQIQRKTAKFIAGFITKTDKNRILDAMAHWRTDSNYSIPPEGEAKKPEGELDEIPLV